MTVKKQKQNDVPLDRLLGRAAGKLGKAAELPAGRLPTLAERNAVEGTPRVRPFKGERMRFPVDKDGKRVRFVREEGHFLEPIDPIGKPKPIERADRSQDQFDEAARVSLRGTKRAAPKPKPAAPRRVTFQERLLNEGAHAQLGAKKHG